jgi:hypothetical protein
MSVHASIRVFFGLAASLPRLGNDSTSKSVEPRCSAIQIAPPVSHIPPFWIAWRKGTIDSVSR